MSSRHRVQDATGVVVTTDLNELVYVIKTASPVGAEVNYIPGALWVNKNGGAGSVLYVNTGTLVSATWLNLG
jgi:hypothetical protein